MVLGEKPVGERLGRPNTNRKKQTGIVDVLKIRQCNVFAFQT